MKSLTETDRGIVLPGWREEALASFKAAMEVAGVKKGGADALRGVEAVAGIPEAIGLDAFKAILADNGQHLNALHAAVVYTGKPDLKTAASMVKKYADMTLEAGGKYLVCSWVNTARPLGPEDFKLARAFYEEQGAALTGGPKLLYHNHAAEFAPETGDGFAEEFSKISGKEFALAADIGWTAWAGYDVKKLAASCGHLMAYIHLRDFRGKEFTAVGKGENPIAAQIRFILTKTAINSLSVEIPLSDKIWAGKADEDCIRFSREGLDGIIRDAENAGN